jgi:glycogen debranching enzyme
MDAKVGDWVVTPRTGKPVELQALWANACDVGARFDDRWAAAAAVARASFADRFWNEHAGCLFDVVDVDHERGRTDGAVRPNQIFAIGGLPGSMLDPSSARARRVVDVVQAQLVTPLGLRSLAAGHPDYRGRYEGGAVERDGAYHEGTVWPWLAGPFGQAWLRVRGDTDDAREEAVRRFVAPLRAHLPVAGLGHVSEIADAEPPHTPRGCPFQAWSVAELLRLELVITPPRPRPG